MIYYNRENFEIFAIYFHIFISYFLFINNFKIYHNIYRVLKFFYLIFTYLNYEKRKKFENIFILFLDSHDEKINEIMKNFNKSI